VFLKIRTDGRKGKGGKEQKWRAGDKRTTEGKSGSGERKVKERQKARARAAEGR